MDASSRDLIRKRAEGRCEYCRLPESAIELPFHVEHIIARQHGGGDDYENIALACDRCNLFKGPNLSSVNPETGEIVSIFNPRLQRWNEHFRFRGTRIEGLTPTGKATVRLLRMNSLQRTQLRNELGLGEQPAREAE